MKYSAKSIFIKIFLILLLTLCLLMPLGCGKKGPPEAPFNTNTAQQLTIENGEWRINKAKFV
jgi:predicted small lipoprotein YifL